MKFSNLLRKRPLTKQETTKENGQEFKLSLHQDLIKKQRIKDNRLFAILFILSHIFSFLIFSAPEQVTAPVIKTMNQGKIEIQVKLKNFAPIRPYEETWIQIQSKQKIVIKKARLIEKVENSPNDFVANESELWKIEVDELLYPQIIPYLEQELKAYPYSQHNLISKETNHEIAF